MSEDKNQTVGEAIAEKGGCINVNNGTQKEICLDENIRDCCVTCDEMFKETLGSAILDLFNS